MLRGKWSRQYLLPVTLSVGIALGVPGLWPDIPAIGVLQAEASKAGKGTAWNFASGLDGWQYGGKYAYKGTPTVAADAKFGGTLRIDADYAAHAADDWSEVKLEYARAAQAPLELAGSNVLSFNLYFDPKAISQGILKTKLYAKSTDDKEVINIVGGVDLSQAKPAADGLAVVTVKTYFTPVAAKAKYVCLSLVGSKTDYHGPLYVGQLQLGYEKVPDGYVDRKVKPVKQQPLSLDALTIPQSVKLTDAKATKETAQLYGYLKGIADSKYVLYGHQDEFHQKVSKNLPGASDTYDMTGDNAAVMGVDSLALTGDELDLTAAEKKAGITLADKLANLYIPVAKKGVVLTMSVHMPNFAQVAKRLKKDGRYDFSGYSPNDLSGDVVQRILPGGDLNAVYTAYLDLVADFDQRLQSADIPLLLRPFHENNGSWFWWGASACTPSQFRNLYRYTVSYFREKKDLHNLLFIYSPNGPIKSTADYGARYPGDEYIDIAGMDIYHHDPEKGDIWMEDLGKSLSMVDAFAKQHGKVATLSEVGIIANNNGCIPRTGNTRPDWFDEVLAQVEQHDMAYMLTWANFDTANFCQPFMVSRNRGQELMDGFIRFYNQPQSIFASQLPDFTRKAVEALPVSLNYGYLVSPGSFTRLGGNQQFTAKIFGAPKQVQVILERDGMAPIRLDAKPTADGQWTAAADAARIGMLGESIGNVSLSVDGRVMDQVRVLYNMKAPAADSYRIDDFEGYYGDAGLLSGAYSKNCGAASDVVYELSGEHAGGSTGLAYHYHLAKGGYAGIVKNLKGVDWTGMDGVELWVKPDGQGQKLILQLNSGGEDFEADLTDVAKTMTAQRIRIPFSQFKGKNGGVFDRHSVQHFGIYCNAVGDKTVDSIIFFDDIRAVR